MEQLTELRELCPDMRFGQILATLGMLGEDAVGRNLWDLEDDELQMAIERFRQDLSRRGVALDVLAGPPRRLGTMRGTVLKMGDDFDAPLDGFRDDIQ